MVSPLIKAPFITRGKIIEEADIFRKKFWNNTVPVDIEKIIEQKFNINIIPIPNLMESCYTDAFITYDWKSIYVDNKKYMDDRYEGRLRFSLAHEIGHLILHREIYPGFGINSSQDFYKFFENINQEQYNYFEGQANKFASYLLIPDDILQGERRELLSNYEIPDGIDEDILNHVIASVLCDRFNVSPDALEIALGRKYV